VAERSQTARLRTLLEQNGLMAEGRVRPAAGTVPADAAREISAALRYLVTTHGTRGIAPWFSDSAAADLALDASAAATFETGDLRVRRIVRALDIPYVEARRGPEGTSRQHFEARKHDVVDIAGWDVLVRLERTEDSAAALTPDTALGAVALRAERAIRITGAGPILMVPLDSVIARARAVPATGWSRSVPGEVLRATAVGDGVEALVLLRSLGVVDSTGTARVTHVTGDVLLRGARVRTAGR
jgi:hypothetical protein